MSTLQIRYQKGRIPFTACQADPRFSYCLYIPEIYWQQPDKQLSLLVIIHGSSRTAERYRDACIELAEQHHCLVLVPLFPLGIPVGETEDLYKLQRPGEVRYDRLLLAMVDEVCQRYGQRDTRFYLHGFSGGGQFAHRFYYLRPQQLHAVSIAAPGQITLPDPQHNWGRGVADMAELFGCELDLTAMKQVPVQLLVGEEDTELQADQSPPFELRSRRERVQQLSQSYTASGFRVTLQTVPGVGHNGLALLPAAQGFLARFF